MRRETLADEKGGEQLKRGKEGRESSVRHAARGIHLRSTRQQLRLFGRRACAAHAQGAPEEIENIKKRRETIGKEDREKEKEGKRDARRL